MIIQPSAEARSVAFFRFHGELLGPIAFPMEAEDIGSENQAQPGQISRNPVEAEIPPAHTAPAQSMESRIRAALESMDSHGSQSAQHFSEELAILKRWYYRSHKVGEIFFADEQGMLPVRRILRAASRVYSGEKEARVQPTTSDQFPPSA